MTSGRQVSLKQVPLFAGLSEAELKFLLDRAVSLRYAPGQSIFVEGDPPGEGFVPVVDHDPKPVFYELDFIQRGKLTWDYLEQGPELWRVRITKTQ